MEKPSPANDRALLRGNQAGGRQAAVVRWKSNPRRGLTEVVDDFAGGVRARCAGQAIAGVGAGTAEE